MVSTGENKLLDTGHSNLFTVDLRVGEISTPAAGATLVVGQMTDVIWSYCAYPQSSTTDRPCPTKLRSFPVPVAPVSTRMGPHRALHW